MFSNYNFLIQVIKLLMEGHKSKPKNNYKVPTKFKSILTDLIKEILINQPQDIINFCANHFKTKQEEIQLGINRSTTFPTMVTSSENNDLSNTININKKKILSKKSTCNKDWDKPTNDNNKIDIDENNEECSLFECINFEEKEKILKKIKDGDNQLKNKANNYYNKIFIPNKKYNDLLITTQKTIMSYYKNKGTEKENEFIKFNEEIESKINELNNDFLLKELDKMQVLDAINLFKKQDFYIRMLKCYLTKINLLKNNNFENNELIDEMCYFIFFPELKLVLKLKDTLKKDEENEKYLNIYFNYNIKLLIPEIFSFVYSIKHLDEDSIICMFSNFSIRKRDLSLHYMQQVIIPSNRELSKILTDLQMKMYISTPEQVLKAIDNTSILKVEEKEEEIEPIEEKIKQNNPILSLFINKITNTPFEAIDNNINEFTGLENIEREIVLKLLKLSPDFSDIYNRLNSVEINEDESNFCSTMKKIYFNNKYIPELDFMYSCIFRNELFIIPTSVKNYLKNFNNFSNSNLNEEQLIQDYQNLNFLTQIGLFLYLFLKKKEKPFLEGLVNKLKYVKEKHESVLHRTHIEALLQNFTHNSDEVGVFKEKYNAWKENLSEDLLEILKKEKEEEKEEVIRNEKDDLNKKIMFNILVIESLIKKDKKLKILVDKIKKNFPIVDESKLEKS